MTESEMIFTQVLGCDRVSLYLEKDKKLTPNQAMLVSSSLERRAKGEPLQYILGKTEFMGLEFKVDKNVLIPRPETEILVETALLYLGTPLTSKLRVSPNKGLLKTGDTLPIGSKGVPRLDSRVSPRVLDLCTGSGCIAISIAKKFPGVDILAVDISEAALRIAQENAELNNVKVKFIRAQLFKGLSETYDLIVCNPPYVPRGQINSLQPELKYEPIIALDGGSDGLEFYREIIKEAPGYLKDDGILIMEMGFGQRESIENILNQSNSFSLIEIIKDYNNIERVIVVKKGRING